jgi:hypothetical protein
MTNKIGEVVHSHIPAGKVRALHATKMLANGKFANDGDFKVNNYQGLEYMGIYGLDKIDEAGFGYDEAPKANRFGMDTIQGNVTVPSVGTLIQNLQGWLPGAVATITAAQTIDDFAGIMTIGAFEDVQIVQQLVENTSNPQSYSDFTNVPLSGVNVNYVYRDTVQWEDGFRIGFREELVGARGRLNMAALKRESVMRFGLELMRNRIGFYGQNSGLNQTYGVLTDPGLPGYVTVATGAVSSSLLWSVKTFQEIYQDILAGIQTIRTQSLGVIAPEKVALTLAVPVNRYDYLARTTDFGISVMDWIRQTYPTIRVISIPEFDGANGGANVFYLFADRVDDGTSTDGGQTFIQMVPAKFIVTGVERHTKAYEEGFATSTAGIMCKRPYAVYRATGI